MPFGNFPAPEESPQHWRDALERMEGMVCIVDDVLIFGEGVNTEKQKLIMRDTFEKLCREQWTNV